MIQYDMRTPCAECPFRRDRAGFLRRGRAEQIARDLLAEGDQCRPFQCHKTIGAEKELHCAGALILLEKIRRPNLLMSLAQKCAGYDWAKLDIGHPHVFHSMRQFVEHHARGLPGDATPYDVNLTARRASIDAYYMGEVQREELPDEPQWRPVGKKR